MKASSKPGLNIIGAGTVGRVLGRLLTEAGQLRLQQVLNTSLASAESAVEFIGPGQALEQWSQLRTAAVWMLASNDQAIPVISERLAETGLIGAGQIVFHLCGALDAGVLSGLSKQGAAVASIHPLKSFPDPMLGYRSFDPTWCALEGDPDACERLQGWFEAIGARVFALASEQKLLYHAANTLLCNQMLALLDVGLECYTAAGIAPQQARALLAPLMQENLACGLSMGPAAAMTGPLLRGDLDTVRGHLQKLPESARAIYCVLGRRVVTMAENSGRLEPAHARSLEEILDRYSIALE